MNSKAIVDWLNIFLVIFSLILAINIPFKLFLLGYAILGPLHYLTEINWLQGKKYFILSQESWSTVLIILALAISIRPILSGILTSNMELLSGMIDIIASNGGIILSTGFLFALCLIYIKKKTFLFAALIICLLGSIMLNYFTPTIILIIGALLPTVVHVYIFTLLFILYGSKREKNTIALINALLLISIPFIISFLDINPDNYSISSTIIENYQSGNFQKTNLMIAGLLNIESTSFNIMSAIGIKIQVFIAFAYIYHYLNWFSKTSVIGWNKALTQRKTFIILFLWLISISLYLYDFKIGLTVLLFLSFLHVFLEFPLNATTIKELLKMK